MLENLIDISGGSGSKISIDSTNNICFSNFPVHNLTIDMIGKFF